MSRDRKFFDKMHNPRWDQKEYRTPVRTPHRSSAIINLICSWRQSGSTTCMVEGLKSQPAAILVSNESYGVKILKKHRLNPHEYKIVSYSNIQNGFDRIDGGNLPMFIDNSFLLSLAEETGSQIEALMRNENDLIAKLDKAEQHKEYKYVEGIKYELLIHKKELIIANIRLTAKQEIYDAYVNRSQALSYFYVQITLFLSLSFFIIAYLIYAFISIS